MLNILLNTLSLEHFVSIVRNYIILEKSKSRTLERFILSLYVIITIIEELLLVSQVFLIILIIFGRVDLSMKK